MAIIAIIAGGVGFLLGMLPKPVLVILAIIITFAVSGYVLQDASILDSLSGGAP